MRRKERQITDENTLQEILKNAIICRVAFQGDGEFPYVLPMNYGYKNGVLYFHCAPQGKKLELIRQNPKVAFEITEHKELVPGKKSCEWTEHYRSILGTGTMSIVEDFTEKVQGLDILMHHHGKLKNAYDPSLIDRLLVLKLTIHSMTGKAHM